MKNAIYFIGGASASGKSVAARKLVAGDGRAIIELDNFYDILASALADHVILEKVTGKIAAEAVIQLLAANAFCLVEGGWIDPSRASKLKDKSEGRFYPVYCGYAHGKVKERLRIIKNGKNHWLAEQSGKAARDFLRSQIELSRWYRKQCEKYALPFFDFSSVEEGMAALVADYGRWQAATRAAPPAVS
ncbi:MAG: hypothetical protein JNK31_07995 [Candidatus Competibacter sp.]|nr:hypothetical protein [Candidatus Competibacter sp.]